MKLLLDTHVFLWLVEGNPKLTKNAVSALGNPANELHLSAASVWELAIKVGNGKIKLNDSVEAYVAKWTATYQVQPLAVEFAHTFVVENLRMHHRDPFDRMIVAQAMVEGLTIVSADKQLGAYGIPIVW